jgi:hypothetical protein
MSGLTSFLRDLFTGPDGQTWAIGRVYGLPVLVAGLSLPFVMIARGQPVDLIAAGGLIGGLGGGVWALIAGTNGVEPPASSGPDGSRP